MTPTPEKDCCPESSDEMAWGEYRIAKREQKFSKNGVNVTNEMLNVRQKIGGKKEPNSSIINENDVLKLKMLQNKRQKN